MNTKQQIEYLYESAEQVESAFYEAFGSGDFVLMESLFADFEVSCTHPASPTIVGRENVIDNWKFVLDGIPKTVIEKEVLSISKGQSIEVRQILESFVIDEFTGEMSEVFTTNVYILQENGWRLQMQHSSLSEGKKYRKNSHFNELNAVIQQESNILN